MAWPPRVVPFGTPPRRRRRPRLSRLLAATAAAVAVGALLATLAGRPAAAQVAADDGGAEAGADPVAAPVATPAAAAAAAAADPDVAEGGEAEPGADAPAAPTPPAAEGGAPAAATPAAAPPPPADAAAALRATYALSIVDDAGLQRFAGTSVVSGGAPVGAWATCVPTNVSAASCFVEEVYQSQVSFVFSYNATLAAGVGGAGGEGPATPAAPTVTASGGDAVPVVQHYTVDAATGKGSFTVLYACTGGHDSLSVLQLGIPLGGADDALSLTWGKVCSGGPHRYLEWGYVAGEAVVPFASPTGAAYTSTPLEQTTVLSLGLRPPAETLAFGFPTVNSSDATVGVAVRGVSKAGGTLALDQRVTITLLYTCAGRSSATIGVSVPIPPWDPLTASWEKDCGGGAPSGLSVGSSSGANDVVAAGVVTPAFDPSAAVRLAAAGRYTVSANASTSTFYLGNGADPSLPALHLDGVALTVTDPAVVRVTVLGGAGLLTARGGAELVGGDARRLKLRYVCLARGVSAVIVTTPLLRYANVEWGVVKACEAAPARRVGFSWRSVSGVEDGIAALLAVGVLGGVCVFQRRRRRAAAAGGGGGGASAVSPRIKYQLAADDEEGLPQ